VALNIPRSNLPNVGQAPAQLPRVRPSMEAANFGGGEAVSNALGQARGLAGDVAGIAYQEERRAQDALFNDVSTELTKLAESHRDNLYKVRGGGALEAQQKMLADYDKAASEVMKRAGNAPMVKDRLKGEADRRRIALEGTTNSYVRGQALEYEEEKAFSKVSALGDSAIKSGDPTEIKMALTDQFNTLNSYALNSGKSKEWLDARVSVETSRVHQGVISNLVSAGRTKDARDYFEANKSGLLGSAIGPIQNTLKVAALQSNALYEANRIMESGEIEAVDLEAGKHIRKEVALDEALEKAKEIEDLELRKQTQHELVRLDGLKRAAREQRYQADVESSLLAVERGEKIPVEVLARLGVTDRQRILSLEREKAKGVDRESDLDILNAFWEQSPEEIASMQSSDMLALREKLSKKDYEDVKAEILSQKGDAAKPSTRAPKIDYSEMRDILDEGGLAPDKLSTAERKKKDLTNFEEAKVRARASARNEFHEAVRAAAAAGKPISPVDQQKLLGEIVKRKAGHLIQTFNTNKQTVPFVGSNTIKKAGELELTDFEDDDWEIPGEVTKKVDGIAKTIGNWASEPMSVKTMRTNMAYVAMAQGQSDAFIEEILRGTRRWPW
jgi:hypothetical protein